MIQKAILLIFSFFLGWSLNTGYAQSINAEEVVLLSDTFEHEGVAPTLAHGRAPETLAWDSTPPAVWQTNDNVLNKAHWPLIEDGMLKVPWAMAGNPRYENQKAILPFGSLEPGYCYRIQVAVRDLQAVSGGSQAKAAATLFLTGASGKNDPMPEDLILRTRADGLASLVAGPQRIINDGASGRSFASLIVLEIDTTGSSFEEWRIGAMVDGLALKASSGATHLSGLPKAFWTRLSKVGLGTQGAIGAFDNFVVTRIVNKP